MSPSQPAPTTSLPTDPEPGEIITFYSYKGGTGRSMALANVGCLLAQRAGGTGRGVLLVDWDLEAPGLHRYFQYLFARGEEGSDAEPGLIDLFSELEREVPPGGYGSEDEAAEDAARLVEKFAARRYALPLQVPGLYLLKAGRFDEAYSELVNTFDWAGLYRRSPQLFRALAARWGEEFDYVLIDSRTGVTDTSGICTILMPEKLVVVFTPNRQSFTGVENLVRKATRHRKGSDDLRPLIVFPLPSRIEPSLQELRTLWRFGDPAREVGGYQPLFESLFREVYGAPPEDAPAAQGAAPEKFDLNEYFEEVQVQQTPDYAYGEEIAVLVERQNDRFSMTRSYQTFTERLVRSEGPWEPLPVDKAATPDAAEWKKAYVLAAADGLYAKLSAEKRENALRLLARLVNVAPPGEGGRDTAGHFKQARLEDASHRAVDALVEGGLVKPSLDTQGETTLALADDALLNDWETLRDWIEKNRDFLFWRQTLRTYLREWEQGGRTKEDLLSGSTLDAAGGYLLTRPQDLSPAEVSYVEESLRGRRNRARVEHALIALAILGLLAGILSILIYWFYWSRDPVTTEKDTSENVPHANSVNTAGNGYVANSKARNVNSHN